MIWDYANNSSILICLKRPLTHVLKNSNNYAMILLLHEPFDPTISYKDLLMFSNKSNMQKALSVMGASASSNLRKAEL